MYKDMLANLRARQQVSEQPFRSEMPIIGSIIVRFRQLWNNVAARWYVRPLIMQQNAFNAALVQTLAQALEELDQRLIDLDHDQVELSHILAETQYRLVKLSRELSLQAEPSDAELVSSSTEV